MTKITTVITDLDNTLWNWVDIWYSSFTSILREGTQKFGSVSKFLDYTRVVNVIHHSSEAYSISTNLITPHFLMYEGAREALIELKNTGFKVIAYTESQSVYTAIRLNACGLDGLIDVVYAADSYGWGTRCHDLSQTEIKLYDGKTFRKPSTDILNRILVENHLSPEEVIYVGDHPIKDVSMAQAMHIKSAYASYGQDIIGHKLSLLRRVSHWSDEDIAFEKELRDTTSSMTIGADRVLDESFFEIIPWIKELNEERN